MSGVLGDNPNYIGEDLGSGGFQSIPPSPSLEPEATPLPPTRSGRPMRHCRVPLRFQDAVPEPAPTATSMAHQSDQPLPTIRRVLLHVSDHIRTWSNAFGMWREYYQRPSYDPDSFLGPDDLINHPRSNTGDAPLPAVGSETSRPPYWPFRCLSHFKLMAWHNNDNVTKSLQDTNSLIKDVILDPDFNAADFIDFDIHTETQRLDTELNNHPHLASFTSSGVNITVPSGATKVAPQEFTIPGLLHRNLVSVIKEAFQSPLAAHFHYSPFSLFSGPEGNSQSPDKDRSERLYGEVYTSDAFLAEYIEVKRHAPPPLDDPTCSLERVVAALMFSSDATMLTTIGDAKAWRVYLMFGNLSKYIRARVDSGSLYHLAYIPCVSYSSFQRLRSLLTT